MKRFVLALTASIAMAAPAWAGTVVLVNGASGTTEVGITNSITMQMTALHEAAGNTVIVSDGVPMDFSGVEQIWDLRFSNNLAFTSTQQQAYVDFMATGGGMFVMGENSSFTSRNNSVLDLIELAGGGDLTFT